MAMAAMNQTPSFSCITPANSSVGAPDHYAKWPRRDRLKPSPSHALILLLRGHPLQC
jgi:hypothetical protein